MAVNVSEACVGCGTCEGTCPVGAIVVTDGIAVVDASACVECGACVSECPVEALSL